jgi:hypothetical protein
MEISEKLFNIFNRDGKMSCNASFWRTKITGRDISPAKPLTNHTLPSYSPPPIHIHNMNDIDRPIYRKPNPIK